MRAHTPTLPPTRRGRRRRRIHSLCLCGQRRWGGTGRPSWRRLCSSADDGRRIPRNCHTGHRRTSFPVEIAAPLPPRWLGHLGHHSADHDGDAIVFSRPPASPHRPTPSSSLRSPPHSLHLANDARRGRGGTRPSGGGGHSPHTRSPSPCVHTVLPTVAATADGPRHGGPARWRWPLCGALLSRRVTSRFSMVTHRPAETPLCLVLVVTARRGRRSPSMLLCLSGGGIHAWRGHARDGVHASRWWTPRGDGCPRLGKQGHVPGRPIGRC